MWLADFDEPVLGLISVDFYAKGMSAVNSHQSILSGRLYGGLAILWRKTLGSSCKIVTFEEEKRIMGIKVANECQSHLLLNVYLPYCCSDNHDDYLLYLSKVESIINEADTPYVFVLGDFNADVNNLLNHIFGRELYNYCNDEGLIISDYSMLPHKTTYTCYSEAHQITSWIDHLVCTQSAHMVIVRVVQLCYF